MRKLLRHRWGFLILWTIITIGFAINQPNLKQILNEKGEATIPENEPSVQASEMLDQLGSSKGDTVILVFYDKNQLSDKDMIDIEAGFNSLNEQKDDLGITGIIDAFGTPEAKDQLISEDNTTMIAQVTVEKGNRDNKMVIDDLDNAIQNVETEHYITGALAIGNDYVNNVSDGVEKSAAITVGFILIVLILMFRSLITPVVSLLAVGVSYLCSMGIIGLLVNWFDFPVTSFTQMFVILVLFGIGTDYHILLFNRYKEELSHGATIDEAVITSFKTAGKTIIYSGLTVFMGFASLSFVKFPVYRSANAVAIGIAVLLIEIMTLTPLLMRIIGHKLFWPSKSTGGHKESKLWGKAATISVKHPVLSLLAVAVVLGSVIVFNTTTLSFDNLKDLSSDNPSIKGFHIVADKFGDGKVMQTTIVLDSEKAMDNNEDLAIIDTLTEKLKGVEGIKDVAGPTQPKGSMIEDLYTNRQTQTVVDGLSAANDGVSKIKEGLGTINSALSAPDFSSVQDLINGTGDLKNGMVAVTDGLLKINDGIDQGAKGADSLASGITQLKSGVSSLNDGLKTVSAKMTDLNNGFTALGQGYQALPGSITQIKQLVTMMQASVASIDTKLPNDADVGALKVMLENLSAALDNLTAGINTANANYKLLTDGLTQLNAGIQIMIASTAEDSELVSGINQLEDGAKQLSDGLKAGSSGQQQVIASMQQLENGAVKIKTGQDTLYQGLSSLTNGMTQLKDGISQSSDGLGAVSDGISKSNDFLNQLTSTKSFYIPAEVADSEDIQKMLGMYMSEDRKTAKLTITLDSAPYSEEAIGLIEDIRVIVENQLKGTDLDDVKIGIAGATAGSNDLKNIATHDITFTQIIVLVAIFILLILVIRSFWIPIYIIGSLVTAYYASLSATAFISKLLFSSAKEGLSWNVPFFAFVMIAALGVDYSIFLMERFREHADLSQKEAIIVAAKNIGGVVMSAAVILAGTFATMYPSNVIVLMELAICVIIGLFLLSFILLPIAIPALMSIMESVTEKRKKN